ncbi:MAG: hypothetical protein IJ155_05780, partial [Prevotella sp.]|nr:hypothetical protein [Prevotella sp.]
GDQELYNSTWVTKTGGYNNEQWGAGSYCRITKDGVSFLFEKQDGEGNAINYQAIQYYPGYEEGVGVETPLPENLVLAAGTYRVIADVDFAKDSSKAMSFDNFTLEGVIEGATGINLVNSNNQNGSNQMFNLAGQRITSTVKGQIFILNGKKYIAK